MSATAIVVIVIGFALIVAVLLYAAFGGRAAANGKPLDDEALSMAALRILRQRGVLNLYTSIGSPEREIKAEEEKIEKLRVWANGLPDAAERRAYLNWLSTAERWCAESRASRRHFEAVERATQLMSKPL